MINSKTYFQICVKIYTKILKLTSVVLENMIKYANKYELFESALRNRYAVCIFSKIYIII